MSNPYARRIEKVRQAMREWGAQLLFLNYGPDMTYLTGITTPIYYPIMKSSGDWTTGLLLGLEQAPVLLLQRSLPGDEPVWEGETRVLPEGVDPDVFLAKVVAEFQPTGKTCAVSKMLWGQTLLSLQAAMPGTRFIPCTNPMMDAIRMVKDDDEIRLMQRAAEITDQALAATVKAMKVGMTERDVAAEVDYQIKLHGGDGCSFYPGIICVGNGSDPQRGILTRNTNMVLAPGTSVAFDYGVLYKGYCSDFGRSAFIGEPRPEALAAYRSITTHAQETMQIMVDGKVSPAQITDYMRDLVAADGFGPWYWYLGLGHGIGLEVHESPWLRPGYTEPIRANMCFTIEPKIWKAGEFYVRCEDVVVVGKNGGTSLTRHSYEPIVIS